MQQCIAYTFIAAKPDEGTTAAIGTLNEAVNGNIWKPHPTTIAFVTVDMLVQEKQLD